MPRLPRGLVAVFVSLAIACGGSSKPPQAPAAPPAPPAVADEPLAVPDEPALPAVPSTPAAAPASLLATGSVGDPGAFIAAAAAYADHVMPGIGANLTLDALRAGMRQEGLGLDGVDFGKPVRGILLDPRQFSPPVVVVVAVADEPALRALASELGLRVQTHNGLAAIGSFDALTEAGGFALTTLAAAPAPAMPTVDFDVVSAMELFRPLIEMVGPQLLAAAAPAERVTMEVGIAMYLQFFAQLEHVTFALDLAGDRASVTMALVPQAGTGLATFIGAQQPSAFAMFERLGPAPFAMGGRLELAPVWQAVQTLLEPVLAQSFGPGMDQVQAVWSRWMALDTGESAFSFTLANGFAIAGGWELDRPAELAGFLKDQIAIMTRDQTSMLTFKQRAAKHRGTPVTLVTATPAKSMPADQRELYDRIGGSLSYGFAATRRHMVLAAGADATARLHAQIDQSLAGKAPPPSPLAPVLADARQRNESYLVAMDLPALRDSFQSMLGNRPGPAPTPGQPTVLGISSAHGALLTRFTLPASQLAAMTRP